MSGSKFTRAVCQTNGLVLGVLSKTMIAYVSFLDALLWRFPTAIQCGQLPGPIELWMTMQVLCKWDMSLHVFQSPLLCIGVFFFKRKGYAWGHVWCVEGFMGHLMSIVLQLSCV